MVARTINETLMEVEHTPPMHKRLLDIMPGVSGGVARVMVGQPFDTIKTRLQVLGRGTALAATLPPDQTYINSMDCVKKMMRNEGALSLYKGTVAPLIGNMVLLGIHFPVFSRTKKWLETQTSLTFPGFGAKNGENAHAFQPINILASGAAAGLAGSVVSTPVELVRTKLQMQRRAALSSNLGSTPSVSAAADTYRGSVDCFVKIAKSHGIAGLYRGFTATILRDVQGYAWFFFGYEAAVHLMAGPGRTKSDLQYWQVMAAGVMAGFGLWGSMFPIDTIKSKMQADDLTTKQYRNTYECYRKTVAVEGRRGLWRGFSAAMYRAIPVNASIFLAVEGTRQFVNDFEIENFGAFAKIPAAAQ